MRYRNIKTGSVIDTFGKISGKDWEELPSSQPVSEDKPVSKQKKSAKTKTSRK